MREHLKAISYGRNIDLHLRTALILVEGDSGTGKTLIYNVFKDLSYIDRDIVCINAEVLDNARKTFKQYKSRMTGKVIIIDNADIILTSDARKSIMFDDENQYIIFGRNSDGLPVTSASFTELVDDGSNIRLSYKYI